MTQGTIERLNAALSGRYHIGNQIGEGGMATVYVADDLKHERKVALKVLKPELAAVVGAERFLAEIKTTANLHHPHILPLFDSGEAEGFLFYVMPFVEGETLRDRIDREKQLPVNEALSITTAVAHALQHAHDRGVIHRDIKPANILLQDGQPVVSDFGIALAVGSAGGARLTETGLSVGTPYYMSPEQATGDQVVGPASDLFALACVLYEMLVGEPPYPGATAQAVLGRIIQGAPVSATAMRKSIPENVDAAIRRALEKLPADRFAGASDFAKALADPSFRHGAAAGAGAGTRARWQGLAAALAAGVLLGGGAVLLGSAWGARPPPPRPVARFEMPFRPDQVPTFFTTNSFALSPEGSFLVYRGPGDAPTAPELWVRRWTDLDAFRLRGSIGGIQPSVSPDGRFVAFNRANEIRIASVEGGPTRTLTPGSWPSWSPDGGTIYFINGANRPARIDANGGVAQPVEMQSDRQLSGLGISQVLPGGTHALAMALPAGGDPEAWAIDLASGDVSEVASLAWPRYADSGHLLGLSPDGLLIAVPFDLDRLETTGPSVPMLEGIAQFHLSGLGDLVYTTRSSVEALGDTELVWVNRDGEVAPMQDGLRFDRGGANWGWRLSPDDTKLAVRRRTDGNNDIWIQELPDGAFRRLTFDDEEQRVPWWSPDGTRVFYLSGPFGARHVWSRAADGTGQPTPVWEDGTYADGLWSPDGEWLVLRAAGLVGGSEGDRSIVAFRPETDAAPVPLIATEYIEQNPTLSPDGSFIAYESNESGRPQVLVRPFPEVESGKWQLTTEGGVSPVWSHSGREVYFVQDGNMMVGTIETEPGFRIVDFEVLFELPENALIGDGATTFDVTSDDQRFVMALDFATSQADLEGGSRYVLVQNFFEELEQRVPN